MKKQNERANEIKKVNENKRKKNRTKKIKEEWRKDRSTCS
jgi:hypothetical protein